MRWWLGIVTLQCLTVIAFSFTQNLCAGPPPETSEALEEKFVLDKELKNFQANVIVTDWTGTKKLSMVKEAHKDGVQVLYRKDTSEEVLFTAVLGRQVTYKFTDGSCSNNTGTTLFTLPDEFLKFLSAGAPITNLVNLTKFVFEKSNEKKGFRSNETVVESGVEGVEWYSCTNTTGTAGIQLRVVYAGKDSISPFSAKSNPVPLSIRITQFDKILDAKSPKSNDISFTFTSFTEPDMQYELFQLPDGVFCNGLDPVKPSDFLPNALPTQFTTHVGYHDLVKQTIAPRQYFYDDIYVGASGSNVDEIKLMMGFDTALALPKNCTTILHDFLLGYQMCFSNAGECLAITEFSKGALDVGDQGRSPAYQLFLPPKTLTWSQYNNVTTNDGNLTIYRASDDDGNKVYEIRLKNAKDLYQVINYQKEMNLWKPTASYGPFLTTKPATWMEEWMRNCYPSKSQDTFSIAFDYEFSSINVPEVFIKALRTRIVSNFTISSPRIKISLIPSTNQKLLAVLTFAEPSSAPRTAFPSGINETATADVVKRLNDTINGGSFIFDIIADDGKASSWTAPKNSFTTYPPPNPDQKPSFYGYTGGAMFVLGIFTFMFGVGLGVGGLFFATRRQRISTFAYQVFELGHENVLQE
ncbi:unnamed protein product, partial [Mesorhabditis belari]|uniref:Uncharacterized protein n=1 Tax=Mesorhabditis belari TaxID=2138241 RepID=A0AAF3F419_9BILA